MVSAMQTEERGSSLPGLAYWDVLLAALDETCEISALTGFVLSPLYIVSALGAGSWAGGLYKQILGTFLRESFFGGF